MLNVLLKKGGGFYSEGGIIARHHYLYKPLADRECAEELEAAVCMYPSMYMYIGVRPLLSL